MTTLTQIASEESTLPLTVCVCHPSILALLVDRGTASERQPLGYRVVVPDMCCERSVSGGPRECPISAAMPPLDPEREPQLLARSYLSLAHALLLRSP